MADITQVILPTYIDFFNLSHPSYFLQAID